MTLINATTALVRRLLRKGATPTSGQVAGIVHRGAYLDGETVRRLKAEGWRPSEISDLLMSSIHPPCES